MLMFKYHDFDCIKNNCVRSFHLQCSKKFLDARKSMQNKIVGFQRSADKRKDGNPTRKSCTK